MRLASALAAAIGAVALTACGSDEVEPSDLTASVPADAELYLEAVLRPEGSQREALESSLSLLLDTDDPGALIIERINEESAEDDSELTYEADVEPWLGERGALFVSDFYATGAEGSGDASGENAAALVEVTDAEAAQDFVDKAAEEEPASTEASYEGVDYALIHDEDDDDEPTATGLIGDHLVFGSEESFQEAVDTDAGGPSLDEDQRFASTLPDSTDAVSRLFVDVPAIVRAADAAGELSSSDSEAIETVFAGIAEEPVAATLAAEPDGFGLDVTYGKAEFPLLAAAEESALLRGLPDDAWFAAGFDELGDAVGSYVRRAEDFGIRGAEVERAEREVLRSFGLRLQDFYGAVGDAAVYASGRGIFGTGGGLVVETDSARRAAEVIAGLRRQAARSGESIRPLAGGRDLEGFSVVLPDAPSTLNFVAAGNRLVIAYGEDAAATALEPEETLESNEEFAAATEALGEELAVALFLDFGPITELLDLAAVSDPSIEEALPYLEAIDYLIMGSVTESGRDRQRLFLGLEEDVAGPAT